MTTITSTDYHDYVIKDGKLIGEFEQMYQNVPDPWHCTDQVDSLKNSLLLGMVHHLKPNVKRALDVGCGLGVLTNHLQQTIPQAEWYACDVSSTAIDKAVQAYPTIKFFSHNLCQNQAFNLETESFDLIVMSEVMWYILDCLLDILRQFCSLLRPNGSFVMLQYFLSPDEQKYGAEIISTPDDLVTFIKQAGFVIEQDVYIGSQPPLDMLLWAKKQG